MDKIKKHWRLILFILMSLCMIIMYEVFSKQKEFYKQELKDAQITAYQDSIKLRQTVRRYEDEAFRYKDSLIQAKINYTILQNENSRKKTIKNIQSIAIAPDSVKDIMWINAWATKDSFPY